MLFTSLTLPLLTLLLPFSHAQTTTSSITTTLPLPSPFTVPSAVSASIIAAIPTAATYLLSGPSSFSISLTTAVNGPATTLDILLAASATRIAASTTAAGANPNNVGLSDGGSTSLHCLFTGSPTATAGTCTTMESDGNVAGAVGVASGAMNAAQLSAYATVLVTGGLDKLAALTTTTTVASSAPLSQSTTGVTLNPAGGGIIATSQTATAPLSETSTAVTLNPAGGGIVTSQTATAPRAGPGTGSSASSVFSSASAAAASAASSESAANLSTVYSQLSQGTTIGGQPISTTVETGTASAATSTTKTSGAGVTSSAVNSALTSTATTAGKGNGAAGLEREGRVVVACVVGVVLGALLIQSH